VECRTALRAGGCALIVRHIAAVSQGTHSEKLIYNAPVENGVDPRSVTRIYSELQPCAG
jgi:hypothetical protein